MDDAPRALGPRWTAAVATGAFLLALGPRVLDHERFVTTDEAAHWFERTEGFYSGLQELDLAATAQAPHPGVTTLWLGSVGRAAWDLVNDPPATPTDHDRWRNYQRFPVAAMTSAVLALSAVMLFRLLPPAVAALAVIFWALDPFVAAHSRILHVDGLVTAFGAASLLAVRLAWVPRYDRTWWVISGAMFGLAAVSKLSAAILLPIVIGTALFAAMPEAAGWRARVGEVVRPMALWAAVAGLTAIVVWPALWGAPLVAGRMVLWGAEIGTTNHESGSFFLGQAVEQPGVLFYPVAIALRLVPWTLIGLVAGFVFAFRRRGVYGWLAIVVVAITLGVTASPKKFDRYALPAFPFLDVLAAVGAAGLIGSGWRRLGSPADSIGPVVGVTAAAGVGIAHLVSIHPYELAHYNEMLGGTPVAAKAILVGWGEGYEIAGDWIRANTSGCDRPIRASQQMDLEPFVCNKVYSMEKGKVERPEFMVFYINKVQRGEPRKVLGKYVGAREPAFVVSFDGVPFVHVFRTIED